ncbi:hypothetical protein ACOME3_006547 [Neoechinorhynchus agilis]
MPTEERLVSSETKEAKEIEVFFCGTVQSIVKEVLTGFECDLTRADKMASELTTKLVQELQKRYPGQKTAVSSLFYHRDYEVSTGMDYKWDKQKDTMMLGVFRCRGIICVVTIYVLDF